MQQHLNSKNNKTSRNTKKMNKNNGTIKTILQQTIHSMTLQIPLHSSSLPHSINAVVLFSTYPALL